MIKKILLAIAVALPMCVSAQTIKLGIVNSNTIFEAMPERTTAQSQLEAASRTYEDEFTKLNDEVNKLVADLQALPKDTPETILERRNQEIQDKYQRIQQFRQSATQDLQRQEQQLMAPITEKIENAIKAVGSEQGFTLILQDMIPSYIDPAQVQDVTPLVKSKLGL